MRKVKTFWLWFYRLWVLIWVLTLGLSGYFSLSRPTTPDVANDRIVPIKAMFHSVFITPTDHTVWIATLVALFTTQIVLVAAGLIQWSDRRRRNG